MDFYVVQSHSFQQKLSLFCFVLSKHVKGQKASSSTFQFFHHLHDNCPGPCQDQVAHGPVVSMKYIEPIYRDHKLADLHSSCGSRPTGVHGLDVAWLTSPHHEAPANSIANNRECLPGVGCSRGQKFLSSNWSLQHRLGVAEHRGAAAEGGAAAEVAAAATAAHAAPPHG